MRDATSVIKVWKQIDKDIKETNLRIDCWTREFKRLENKVNNLISHFTFLEEANIEKEGQINYLKGVVDLMSDKLCQ